MRSFFALGLALLAVAWSATIPTGLGTGGWLLLTLPGFPIIYFGAWLVAGAFGLEDEAPTEEREPSRVEATLRRLGTVNTMLLFGVAAICISLWSVPPNEAELTEVQGELTDVQWRNQGTREVRFEIMIAVEGRARTLYFDTGPARPAALEQRLWEQRDELIGQFVVARLYSSPPAVFTLQIGDSSYRTFAEGVEGFYLWRKQVVLIGMILSLAWIAAFSLAWMYTAPTTSEPRRTIA